MHNSRPKCLDTFFKSWMTKSCPQYCRETEMLDGGGISFISDLLITSPSSFSLIHFLKL